MGKKLLREEVLVYRKERRAPATVRRHYEDWRKEHSIPLRYDVESCQFYSKPLKWNGKDLDLILDHINGNNCDNRPNNLRFICPNCDSQQKETRGGANKGRIEKEDGGFALLNKREGKRQFILPTEPGKLSIEGPPASLLHPGRQVKKN